MPTAPPAVIPGWSPGTPDAPDAVQGSPSSSVPDAPAVVLPGWNPSTPTAPSGVIGGNTGVDPDAPNTVIPDYEPPPVEVRAQIVVTGTISPDMRGTYTEAGHENGRAIYRFGFYQIAWNVNDWWEIGFAGGAGFSGWRGPEDVDTPDQVGSWEPFGMATGNPILALIPGVPGLSNDPVIPEWNAGAPTPPPPVIPDDGGTTPDAPEPVLPEDAGGGPDPDAPVYVIPPKVTYPPILIAPPEILGSEETGLVLTCDRGTWKSLPTYAYQWILDGQSIAGATSSTLLVPASGSVLTCRVTATNNIAAVEAIAEAPEFLWPVIPLTADYTLAPEDRSVVLSFSEATVKTVTVDGLEPGDQLVIEQRGWGRTVLAVDQDTLDLPAGKLPYLDGHGARVLLTCDVAGTVVATGDLEDVDPIRAAIGEANILVDLDGDWGVVERPAYEAGRAEAWYSRTGNGIHTKATFPRENQYYLRIWDHPTIDQTLQSGIAGSSIFPATFVGLGDIPQPYTVILVISHIDATTAPVLYDGTSASLIGQNYYWGYDLNAGVFLTDGGPNNPRWDYKADLTAAPTSLLAAFNGASSKLYIENALKSSGDAGTNAIQGSTLTLGGDARNLFKRLIIVAGEVANPASVMATVCNHYGIPLRP